MLFKLVTKVQRFFESLLLGFYTGLFNLYSPYVHNVKLYSNLESSYSSTASGNNIWHGLFPHQTFAIFIDYSDNKGHVY